MERPGNGKTGEFIRWIAGLALAGLVSYFTAQGSIQERIGRVEEREINHYEELLRRLDRIERKLDYTPYVPAPMVQVP